MCLLSSTFFEISLKELVAMGLLSRRNILLTAFVLEGDFYFGAIGVDFAVFDHHVEFGNLGDTKVAEGLCCPVDGCGGGFFP